ncbi:hypothetical protein DPMN_156258 [Dreissena polymorpha]|nr:hypothetical protein DPMN_156258 [Dreissena polymorpha]
MLCKSHRSLHLSVRLRDLDASRGNISQIDRPFSASVSEDCSTCPTWSTRLTSMPGICLRQVLAHKSPA